MASFFSVPTKEYSAYLISGMIGWTWVSALLTDMGSTFITYSNYIKGMAVDKAQLVWASAFKQIVVLCHNLLVYAVAAAFGVFHFNVYTLLFIPAALIFFSMTIPLTALTAILFARYRDLPRLVSSLMVVILLLTPVFWMPTMVKGWRSAIFYANPIYYGVEFLRAPLLGKPPDILVISVFLSMTAIVWVVGSFFYRRFHRYVAFWV